MNAKIFIKLMFAAVVTIVPAAGFATECASPVSAGDFERRDRWNDLQQFAASNRLNSVIQTVQSISQFGVGDINNDFYSVTVDAGRDTPQTLAAYLRANFDRIIFSGTGYTFSPYDAANAQKWTSTNPKGAVMTFVLASLASIGVGGPEVRGSVVMSCESSAGWIFSTVKTAKDGWHPVSGNRAFGVSKNGDGSLMIWTKGADRAVNAGAVGLVHVNAPPSREQTFAQGKLVWQRKLNNLIKSLKDRHPRDRQEYSVRRSYVAP